GSSADRAQGTSFRRPAADPRDPPLPSSYRYLLDLDDDLAQEFDLRMRVVAVPVGERETKASLDATRRGFGVLVIDGVLACDTHVGDRIASELVGPGDLLQCSETRLDD